LIATLQGFRTLGGFDLKMASPRVCSFPASISRAILEASTQFSQELYAFITAICMTDQCQIGGFKFESFYVC